ncbi:MAG: ATP-dependent helicase [Lachnospiraceae bacterium]|nr:ATP-dependent helicase [Lachnospiraceae bacterium]
MPESVRESNYYRMLKTPLTEGLNEAQREAVMHGEGPALVAAGPGSGKTLTMIRRVLYLLLERKVSAEKILVITYTKEAAVSMQEKFVRELKKYQNQTSHLYYPVSFGTFHSCFFQFIKRIKKYSEFQLITQKEKYNIGRMVLKECLTDTISEENVRVFLEHVSFYKNTANKPKEEWFAKAFSLYEDMLTRYRRLDFDDMLYLCKRVFQEDAEILAQWQNRYQYILIDEYQDINPVQYDLISLWLQKNRNLFVVGDDDQAIYGFRGSDSDCFEKLKNSCPDIRIIYLNINYRCENTIVDASKRLIMKNKMRMEKNMVTGVEGCKKGKITVFGDMNTHSSCDRLVGRLQEEDKETLARQAILFRTNASLQMMAGKLSKEKIPYQLREKIKSVYEHFIAKDVEDYYMAANGCLDRSLWLRILSKSGLIACREYFKKDPISLSDIKSHFRTDWYEDKQMLSGLENLERHLARLKNFRPSLGMKYILHAMNYETYLLSKVRSVSTLPDEWRHILEWLTVDAEAFASFNDWKEHWERYKLDLENSIAKLNDKKEGIHLMTLHASKGLEFEKVYIMNMNEGIFPRLPKGEVSEKLIEEERRLMYVGITRARQEVELYYMTGTRENPRLKSRFIQEMGIEAYQEECGLE